MRLSDQRDVLAEHLLVDVQDPQDQAGPGSIYGEVYRGDVAVGWKVLFVGPDGVDDLTELVDGPCSAADEAQDLTHSVWV